MDNKISFFKSIEDVYRAMLQNDPEKIDAKCILNFRDWFNKLAHFDPRSGEATPKQLSDFLDELLIKLNNKTLMPNDRIARILNHSKESIGKILLRLKTKISREHEIMPIYAAREVDSNCIMWLSRKDGRNIREKLSGRPYLKAVKRRQSLDTTENRLFKDFCYKLVNVLQLKQDSFKKFRDEDIEELIPRLERWLVDADADEIGSWKNLPPNNILLQEKNYRKIWDSWLWLQRIDADTENDHKRVMKDWMQIFYWTLLAKLRSQYNVRIPEQPCDFDYDNFFIEAYLKDITGLYTNKSFHKSVHFGKVEKIREDKNKKEFYFIGTDDGKSIFCHINDISGVSELNKIKIGTKLTFDIQKTEKGVNAKNAKILHHLEPVKIEPVNNEEINLLFNNRTVKLKICGRSGTKVKIEINERQYMFEFSSASVNEAAERMLKESFSEIKANMPASNILNYKEAKRINSSAAAIDLSSIRPRFLDDNGSETLPFRLIEQLWRSPDKDDFYTDLGNSNAIKLASNITTLSIINLFSLEPSVDKDLLNHAAMKFSEKISHYMNTGNITYIVPDKIDDFSLEYIRKSMNFHFKDAAQPLPISIAAALSWQASKNQEVKMIKPGDSFIIVDFSGDVVSLTPLIARKEKKLEKIIPESFGLYWERHPCIIGSEALNKLSSEKLAIKILKKCGSAFPDELGKLIEIQGLIDEKDDLSWIDEKGTWFTPPENIKTHFNAEINNPLVEIQNLISNFCDNKLDPHATIYVITVNDALELINPDHFTIKKVKNRSFEFLWCAKPLSLAEGGMIHWNWQSRAENIPLWKDHLPELAIRVRGDKGYNLIYLVKSDDKPIIPRRNSEIKLPINEIFVLPANRQNYVFPIVQGTSDQQSRYEAYLSDQSFPLGKDVRVKLDLTFRYGSDNPYELRFIPIPEDAGHAGFKFVKVKWRPITYADIDSLPSPLFPKILVWKDFEKGQNLDMLNKIQRQLETIKNAKNFILNSIIGDEKNVTIRHFGTVEKVDKKTNNFIVNSNIGKVYCYAIDMIDKNNINEELTVGSMVSFDLDIDNQINHKARTSGQIQFPGWKKDRNQKYYCYASSNSGDVFCHEDYFILKDNIESLPLGAYLSFEIIKRDDGRLSAKNIIIGNSTQLSIPWNITIGKTLPQNTVTEIRRALRFPVFTVWNNSNSLSDLDAPDWFRRIVKEGVDDCLELIDIYEKSDSNEIDDKLLIIFKELTNEALFFLFCLHSDMPSKVLNKVVEILKNLDSNKKSNRKLAYTIGNASSRWQKDILTEIIKKSYNSVCLEMLGIAIWRSENIVDLLSNEQINFILNNLKKCIKYDVDFIQNDLSIIKKQKNMATQVKTIQEAESRINFSNFELQLKLELLLGLLRTRRSNDSAVKRLITPNTKIARDFDQLIDEVKTKIHDAGICVKSRINLKIKPDDENKTPDLLYALHLYLTGDSGADAIGIIGINEE